MRTEEDRELELIVEAVGIGTVDKEEMGDDDSTKVSDTDWSWSDTIWTFGSAIEGEGRGRDTGSVSIPAFALATASIIEAPLSENCCVPTTETTSYTTRPIKAKIMYGNLGSWAARAAIM